MKIGYYVRLDRCQGINKITGLYTGKEGLIEVELQNTIYDEWADETFIVKPSEIIKSNKYIKNLLEVGDIVHYKIKTAMETSGYMIGYTEIPDEESLINMIEDNDYKILGVITKEQLPIVEYIL